MTTWLSGFPGHFYDLYCDIDWALLRSATWIYRATGADRPHTSAKSSKGKRCSRSEDEIGQIHHVLWHILTVVYRSGFEVLPCLALLSLPLYRFEYLFSILVPHIINLYWPPPSEANRCRSPLPSVARRLPWSS